MSKLISLLLSAIICAGTFAAEAQTPQRHYLTFKEKVQPGLKSAPRQGIPLKANRLSSSKCIINLDFDESVPDSIRTAITAAKNLWETALPAPKPIYIYASYEPLESDVAMLAEVVHFGEKGSADKMNGCPSALLTQLTEKQCGSHESPDGVIVFNSDIQWNCYFSNNQEYSTGYNAATTALRSIALCIGFGSSIIAPDNSYEYAFEWPTFFDKLLHSGNTFLSSLEQKSVQMKNFVTSNNVTLSTAASTYKVYAPSKYEPYKSLVYLDNNNSLMSHSLGEGSLRLTIDDSTKDILRTLGWNIPETGRKIIGEDIGDDGIGSSYEAHKFKLSGASGNIKSYKWTFSLKDKSGTYVQTQSASTNTITVNKVASTNNYFINLNGDLEGKLECEYVENGKTYTTPPFYLYLELKPMIISIDNIKKIPVTNGFNLQFSVSYAGSDELSVEIEEDYSSVLRSYHCAEPYIAHVKTSKISNSSYSWATVTVRNKYGTSEETLEFAPVKNRIGDRVTPYTIDGIEKLQQQSIAVKLYSVDGRLKFSGSEPEANNANLPEGIYIKESTYPDGTSSSTKIAIR